MSTFNGILPNFPTIRIDYFRPHSNQPPPVACLLSHVHSDHLVGLESPVLPFIYCSAGTARLLLRMETSSNRLNFERGILEARKTTYSHLRKVVKPLPLGTPTVLELSPKAKIRLTLFDANHCPGAVMFLIEGDGRAVLYTGDVRAEAWWVDSLVRHPGMIPYSLGNKSLDCIYLDTTFAAREDIYQSFPTKAAGLAELIEKVTQYPPETVFYFRAWTLGYEDAWMALAAALSSRIHVDSYQMRLYSGLADGNGERLSVPEAPALAGFEAGNHFQPGCLTDDPDVPVRVHSCEPGTACHAGIAKRKDIVWIMPIISRMGDGTELYEIGAGRGGGDLYHASKLSLKQQGLLQALRALCKQTLRDPSRLEQALDAVIKMADTDPTSFEGLDIDVDVDSYLAIKLEELIKSLSNPLIPRKPKRPATAPFSDEKLTTRIHFPYGRHSSYSELRYLISAFKPKDICPCTVELSSWKEDVSMEALFGDLCSEQIFAYDAENRIAAEEQRQRERIARKKRKRDINDDQDPVIAQDYSPAEPLEKETVIRDKKLKASASAGQQQLQVHSSSSSNLDSPTLHHLEHTDLPVPVYGPMTEDGHDHDNVESQIDTQTSTSSLSLPRSAFASQSQSPTSPNASTPGSKRTMPLKRA